MYKQNLALCVIVLATICLLTSCRWKNSDKNEPQRTDGASRNTITTIVANYNHTCILTSGGKVQCWGSNENGQLGDGTTEDRLTPVEVSGLSSGVKAIAAGSRHTCAITSGGGAKCWGENGDGQLGDGTKEHRLTPVDVSGLSSGVKAIVAGSSHTCAITSGGGAKCWGSNFEGKLGDGTTENRLTPVNVKGLSSGVETIAIGFFHTCALTSGGGVKCWGSNGSGQLGDGTKKHKLTPVDVRGLTSDVRAITTGDSHTCALTSNGGVKCWGINFSGELGDGTREGKSTPVDVYGLTSGVKAIVADTSQTCAIISGEGMKCWGLNRSGQLGDGTTEDRLTPLDVRGLTSGAKAIAMGGSHTCIITNSGSYQCWGANWNGQLGNGTTWRVKPKDQIIRLTPQGVEMREK